MALSNSRCSCILSCSFAWLSCSANNVADLLEKKKEKPSTGFLLYEIFTPLRNVGMFYLIQVHVVFL